MPPDDSTLTPEDQAFFDRYGGVFFQVHTNQFSHDDLSKIFFPDTMLKLGNWIAAGYVKPDYQKDHTRGGPDRRRYSIVEITRISIIDSLVNGIGLKPSQAAQVADFGIPFLNDTIERHPDNTLKSTARIYIASRLNREDGRMKSAVYYRKLDDPHFYSDDPNLNPDAKPLGPLAGTAIHLPLTDVFNKIFIQCAKFLVINKRGGVDKFRRPVDV